MRLIIKYLVEGVFGIVNVLEVCLKRSVDQLLNHCN